MPVYLCNMYNFFFIIHVKVSIGEYIPKVGKGKFYLCIPDVGTNTIVQLYNVVM